MINSSQAKQDPGASPAADPVEAAREPFLGVIRELSQAYQAFNSYSDAQIRTMGLTSPQFDVIATLGNTAGMTMNVLAERTLVTKGTLTGIVDRLEQKGLVQRQVPPENRRCFKIVLTPAGEQVFAEAFPAHVHYLKQRFSLLSAAELDSIRSALRSLHQLFTSA